MKLHGNAELSLNRRRRLVQRVAGGWTLTKAAEAAEVSVRTARKWVRRHRAEGELACTTARAGHTALPPRPPSSGCS
jgi:transposase